MTTSMKPPTTTMTKHQHLPLLLQSNPNYLLNPLQPNHPLHPKMLPPKYLLMFTMKTNRYFQLNKNSSRPKMMVLSLLYMMTNLFHMIHMMILLSRK